MSLRYVTVCESYRVCIVHFCMLFSVHCTWVCKNMSHDSYYQFQFNFLHVCKTHSTTVHLFILPPRDAIMLLEDLQNALAELEGEDGVPIVPVELVNPNVAKIFSKSPRAKVSPCSIHVCSL